MKLSRHIGKRLTCQRVLLAVYWLSDDLCCRSSNAEISKVAGRHPGTVDEYLTHLERAGVIGVFGRRNGLKSRVIVLLDHPEAETFMRSLGMNNRLTRWDWMIADCEEMNSGQ